MRLFKEKKITYGKYKVNLKIGALNVLVEKSRIYLEQDIIKVLEIEKTDEILKSLNIKDFDLDSKFNIVIAYSGLRDILIPIKLKEKMNTLDIDFKLIEEISEKNKVVGYHVFTFFNNNIYCRNFAPLYGIAEESATGSSNGALLGYLFQKNFIKEGEYKIFQGENFKETSLIYGKVLKNNKIYIGSEF